MPEFAVSLNGYFFPHRGVAWQPRMRRMAKHFKILKNDLLYILF
jgi:hypothetical protein